jgi:hypothetical protein
VAAKFVNLRQLDLYFGGAEVPTWRKLLAQEHVPHVAVNFFHLKARLPQKEWLLADHFPPDQDIFLLSGASSSDKKNWTTLQHEEFLTAYVEFVRANVERLTYFTEYDPTDLGLDWVLGQRQVWAGAADDKFVPVWHEEWGSPLLRTMVEEHPNIGVPPVTPRTVNVLGSLVRRTRIQMHGLSFGHPYDTPGGLYSSIVSSSWISPTRFGETVIWDQNRLRRYPADEKVKIRTRHAQHFAQAGFDAHKILHDDNKEVARYTIWAWRQMESGANRSTHNGDVRVPVNGSAPVELVDHLPVPVQENGDGRQRLPVFNFRPVTSVVPNPEGSGTVEVTTQVAHMGDADLRKCDSCALAAVCALYETGASCRYSIPMEIRNRDQLLGVLYSLLEMQGQRVQFTFLAEQLQGGYPDANLSSELDRFMNMTAKVKDIQDNRDFLKVTVEGRAQAGVLSRLFGAERADNLRRVDADKAENAVRKLMTD